MNTFVRLRTLGLLVLAAGLAGAGGTMPGLGRCLAQDVEQPPGAPDPGSQDPQEMLMEPGQDPNGTESGRSARRGRGTRTRGSAATKTRGRTTKGAAKNPDAAKAGTDTAKSSAPAPAGLLFSRDVAPILVANCVRCHKDGGVGLSRGKLNLTTFEKLMKGTPKEKVIDPGKADDSHLVLRIKGDEMPRMPQGDNNALSNDAIATIEKWVKAGAKLDSGLDPKAPIESYAASPDELRKIQTARLSVKERDQKVEAAGRQRWKQANPKLTPELNSSEHFVLFSNLPRDRAANAVKSMEAQYTTLKRLLGPPATEWVEKVSLYVFNDRKDFVEFARTVENRDVLAGVAGDGNLAVPQPYVVVLDPLNGRKDEPPPRRRTRPKPGEDKDAAPERTLIGLLAENLARSTVDSRGKPPRWLAIGLGLFLASQVEPRSPLYGKLRRSALELYDKGWPTKAIEALGEGENSSAEDVRTVGYAVVSFLMSPPFRASFPALAKGMKDGKEKLDDVLKEVYGATREEFINQAGDWVAEQYGQDR